MSKRYRAVKPLPDGTVVGDVFVRGSNWYENERLVKEAKAVYEHHRWETWQVENNPEWFEEVKEQERIEVVNMSGYDNHTTGSVITFETSAPFPKKIFPAIKSAIENVLNGLEFNDAVKVLEENDWLCMKRSEYNKSIAQQLEEAERRTFDACRETRYGGFSYVHRTFEDYKNNQNPQSRNTSNQ